MTPTIPIASIEIGERQRNELGDIPKLAATIAEVGLIQPIVLDENNRLIAGRRRLAACTHLGWTDIPFVRLGELNPMQKQIAEYVEDVERKDRSWQEKCLAVRKIFQLKTLESQQDGESWTVRKMEAFTGISKSNVDYMCRLAEHLKTNPISPVWNMLNYTDGIKHLLHETEMEVQAEMERRRALVAAPTQAVYNNDSPEVKPLDEVLVPLYGTNAPFLEPTTEKFGLAVCYQPTTNLFAPVMQSLRLGGFAVFWLDSVDPVPWRQTIKDNGFFAMPFPLVWDRTIVTPHGDWPFSPSFSVGIVASNQPVKENPRPQSGAVVRCPVEPGKLPFGVTQFTVKALSLMDERVLLVCGSNPSACAASGRVPVWYEASPTAFSDRMTALRSHYENTIPNVRFE